MQLETDDRKHKKSVPHRKNAGEAKASPHRKNAGDAKTTSHKKNSGVTKALPSNRLKLLVTVVDRRKGEFYADLLQSFEVNMQMMCFGRGTAKAEMLRYLGLADSEKTVIFSVIREETEADALSALEEKFAAIKNGKGVAFTVPMSGIIGVAIYGFLSNNRSAIKETL